MDFLGKIIEILKLPFRFIVLLSIVMGLLLFMPNSFIETLKLNEFISENGKYIGIVFVFSIGYMIISVFPMAYKYLHGKRSAKKFEENVLQTLLTLNHHEQCFLREFFIQNKDVIEAPLECTELTSLYNKGIVLFASNNVRSFIYGHFTSVTINPIVKGKINNTHLGLPDGNPSTQEIERIKSERPEFLFNLERINEIMNPRRRW